MVRKNHIVKINIPGGIIPAGDMYTIMCAAEIARVEQEIRAVALPADIARLVNAKARSPALWSKPAGI